MKSRRKKILGVTVAAMLVAAVAWASWTADGTGSGTATAGESEAVEVSVTIADDIYPTGEFDVDVDVYNPNPFKVHVSSIAEDDITTEVSGCTASELSFDEQTNGGLGWDIAAEATLEKTFTDALNVTNNIEDECQGADFDVSLTASAQSTD